MPQHKVLARYQGRHVRLVVIVEPGVTKQQLEELTKDLAEKKDAERIDYVDFPELIVAKPSLGFWDRHEVSALREKDWRKRPDTYDVQLWAERGSISAQDEDAVRELATKHSLTVDMVKGGIAKVRDWIANADTYSTGVT